jgi:hypothetical protein
VLVLSLALASGGLPAAVESLHEGDDGIVQVFLSRPTSIHLTFQADQGTRFLALLQQIVSGAGYHQEAVDRSGGDMGLFGTKAASRDPVISFTAGQQPPPGTSIENFLVSLALSVSPSSEIAREDVRAYSEASYATVLGIPDSDTIIAWGPGRIETPQDGKPRLGTVVVTRNTMLAYWQPGRTSLIHTFQGNHSAVIGYQRTGDHSLNAQWEIAEYADNNGKFIVGNAPVFLTADLGKDGHANRRALTWFYTLAYLLNSSDGSQPPGPPPSGGLGSSGTKL